jgi:hypothetical protein
MRMDCGSSGRRLEGGLRAPGAVDLVLCAVVSLVGVGCHDEPPGAEAPDAVVPDADAEAPDAGDGAADAEALCGDALCGDHEICADQGGVPTCVCAPGAVPHWDACAPDARGGVCTLDLWCWQLPRDTEYSLRGLTRTTSGRWWPRPSLRRPRNPGSHLARLRLHPASGESLSRLSQGKTYGPPRQRSTLPGSQLRLFVGVQKNFPGDTGVCADRP